MGFEVEFGYFRVYRIKGREIKSYFMKFWNIRVGGFIYLIFYRLRDKYKVFFFLKIFFCVRIYLYFIVVWVYFSRGVVKDLL